MTLFLDGSHEKTPEYDDDDNNNNMLVYCNFSTERRSINNEL